MKQWKRICALAMSVLSVFSTVLSAGCKDDENTGSNSSVRKHTHVWSTGIDKAATCTEKGMKKKTCNTCGEVEYEERPIRLIGLSVSNPHDEDNNDTRSCSWEQLELEFDSDK